MQALSPFAKAIVPGVLALLTAVGNALVSGSVDKASLILAATGLLSSLLAYLIPNSVSEPAQGQLASALATVDHSFAPDHAGHPDPEPPAPATPEPGA